MYVSWLQSLKVRSLRKTRCSSGEAFPAHFERYVRREQTTGSAPRRTWLSLADWMPLDFKSPAKLAADLKLSHVENVRQKVLADELQHQVPGEKRHAFVAVGHEFTEELVIRSDVHDAIDAKADGEPIPDDAIDRMIAAARHKALSFLVVAKTGSRGATLGTIIGLAPPGARVRYRAKNLSAPSRTLPWSAWATVPLGRNVWSFTGIPVGSLASDVGQKIEIEIERDGGRGHGEDEGRRARRHHLSRAGALRSGAPPSTDSFPRFPLQAAKKSARGLRPISANLFSGAGLNATESSMSPAWRTDGEREMAGIASQTESSVSVSTTGTPRNMP